MIYNLSQLLFKNALVKNVKPLEKCRQCGGALIDSYFDTIWKMPDKTERIVLDLIASVCKKCPQIYVTRDVMEIEKIIGGLCTSAMESDKFSYPLYFEWKSMNDNRD